jgi:hypothetical protein
MGRIVAETVARRLGRTLLELGGNNGVIVMNDANLDLALRAVCSARWARPGSAAPVSGGCFCSAESPRNDARLQSAYSHPHRRSAG